MRNRKFGVELEFGFGQGWSAAYEHIRSGAQTGKISADWFPGITQDGTCCEIKSPILEGSAGFRELKRCMEYVVFGGGYVTGSDGMHVHHDAPEYVDDRELAKVLVKTWIRNRKLIGEFVETARNHNGACPQWGGTEETYDQYTGPYLTSHFGRRDLNVSSLNKHGTVELRLHEGCLDFDRAESWIRFGQAFLNKVAATGVPVEACSSHEELLRKLRVAQSARARLLGRAAVAA